MSLTTNMTYNSQRPILTIAEYGRHIHNLVDYAKTIEDKEERQKVAERVVRLMLQLKPQSKNIVEYKAKLWNQLFIMANFEIDVTPPDGKIPTPETVNPRPDPIEYPKKTSHYRHYGNNVQLMIDKAISMEDSPIRDAYCVTIASFMKLAFRTWNSDHNVSDDVIKADFEKLAKGKLKVKADLALDALANSTVSRPKANVIRHHKGRKQKRYSNNRGSNNNSHKRRR